MEHKINKDCNLCHKFKGITSILLTGCLFFSISLPNPTIAINDISVSASRNLTLSANMVTQSIENYNSTKEDSTSYIKDIEIPQEKFDPNYFKSPVSDSSCEGYTVTRGWTPGHTGVDIQKKGGCWINSIASGEITKQGFCDGGLGFCVEIEHDNGYKSLYAHGDGQFKLKVGNRVNPGDKIMYMGCSGKCTGTHLHLSLAKPGSNLSYNNRINPSGIIPV